MALISCPNCGKEISSKALTCPGCGAALTPVAEQIPEAKNICKECGAEFDLSIDCCPNCGCPKEAEPSSEAVNTRPQKVEVTNVSLNPNSKKNLIRAAVIAVIVILVIAAIAMISSNMKQKKAEEEAAAYAAQYSSNLSLSAYTMLSGAAQAESAGNLIKSVWSNAINKDWDIKTDKYTRPDGYFEDFNTALSNLFSDSSFINDIQEIKSNQDEVNTLMKELKNPPDEYKEAYDTVKNMYDAYLDLTNLATNPTGSLTTFSQNFSAADTATVNAFEKVKLYLD